VRGLRAPVGGEVVSGHQQIQHSIPQDFGTLPSRNPCTHITHCSDPRLALINFDQHAKQQFSLSVVMLLLSSVSAYNSKSMLCHQAVPVQQVARLVAD